MITFLCSFNTSPSGSHPSTQNRKYSPLQAVILFHSLLTRQWLYHCLTDRVIFFHSGFWRSLPVTIPWSHRPGFFIFFKHIFNPKRLWLYYGLTDWVKKNRSVRPGYGHWCPCVKCLRKKKNGLTDHGMVTGVCYIRVVTGGLKLQLLLSCQCRLWSAPSPVFFLSS